MLIAAVVAGSSEATAQPLTLAYQQVVTRPVPGATAAFALDPSLVGASAQDGVVTLVGRGPGSTSVIVIVGERTVTLGVVVKEPPLIVLPGLRRDGIQGGRTGYYETRYGSNPGLLQGSLFLSRREGQRSAELSLGGAAPREPTTGSRISLPIASFTLRDAGREITLLDRVVANSPLTISSSNVRGLYVRQGPWQVHAGYSFFSTFEHLLLPTNKEAVAGAGYRRQLSPRSSLTPNLYYFAGGPLGERRGALGTLFYEARPTPYVRVSAELAASRTVGGAASIDLDRPGVHAWAKLRLAPRDLPSLTTDQQSGRQIEGGWQSAGEKTSVNAFISARRYQMGTFDRSNTVAGLDLQRQLPGHWAIHGGSGLSLFDDASASASKIQSLTLPVGASYSRKNGGAGIDYQFSRETTRDLGGHLIRANVNGAGRGVRVSMFGERQTHAPTVRQILTDVPWLQPMLDRLGVAADTPQQLADLVRTNADLSAYGYASTVRLDVAPVRVRAGASGGWSGTGSRRPQLSLSTLFSRDEAIDRASISGLHSLSYSQRLDRATEMFFSWSALCRDSVISRSTCHPLLFASLRRTLDGGPSLLRTRRGAIDGLVFKDDGAQGRYTPGLPPVADVEVVLDDARYTRTDASGRFRFDDVPVGRHRVEARSASGQATFFTTPSPAEVDTGGSVEFGIALSRSSLRGVVRTDAGAGVSGVLLHITGADRRTTARTGDDGAFVADGLVAGDYDVSIEAGSVPVGYPVDTLAARRVHVEESAAGRVTFVLRPYRTVAGHARIFDRESGRYVALAGATVELLPLQRQSVTDAQGQYAFRDLPPGDYTVVARRDGREQRSSVTVPDGPALVKDVDMALVPAAAAVTAAASSRGIAVGPAIAARTEEPSSGGRDQFTIEVAGSNSVRHARAMVDELKDAGHAAYLVQPALAGTNQPYQVRVGVYSSRVEADRSARVLEKTLGWRMSVTTLTTALAAQGKAASYAK
jgi:cell division septation protein DedD